MKKINTALLSFGMSGRLFHAPFIDLHPGYHLMGSWERSTKSIQEHYPEAISYGSLEKVLSDKAVDLVVVNTPTSTHYEYAKKALQAGKHVIVEKAFTANAEEAMELKSLAEKAGKKLSVYQNRRWASEFKTVQKILNEGQIGEIVEATFAFARYRPELSPKTHKEKPSPGAGIIKDLGAHIIDQAVLLFGMPKSVFADIAITRPGSQVDDYFDILLRYDKHRVHLKSGYFFREPAPAYILHGTKGSFLKSRADVQEDRLQAGEKPDVADWGVEPKEEEGLLHTELGGKVIRKKVPTLPGNFMDYFEGMYQAITEDKPEPVTAQEGINTMRIIDAAFESQEKGKLIEV